MGATKSDVDLNANQQGTTLAATIPFATIAVIAVVSRFISRKIQSSRYEFDDHIIVFALICTLGCFALSMEMVHLGSGRHLAVLPPGNGPKYLKCLFAYEILYGNAIASIKLSILSLYRRIFSVRNFKMAANIVTAMVLAWVIALVLTAIFSCNPVNGFWDKVYTKSKCINTEHFFIGNAVANMGTDLIILILPVQQIWRLQMRRNQKFALSFIFLLGGFVIVASAVRLKAQFSVNDPDFFWMQNATVIWSSIEPSVGVTCACLPTLRPLLLYIFPQLGSRAESKESNQGRPQFAPRDSGYMNMGSSRANSKRSARTEIPATTTYASFGGGRMHQEDMILNGITVQKDLHLTSETV